MDIRWNMIRWNEPVPYQTISVTNSLNTSTFTELSETTMYLKPLMLLLISFTAQIRPEDCFRAAVYEHFRAGNASIDEPSVLINKNLNVLEEMATIAAKNVFNWLWLTLHLYNLLIPMKGCQTYRLFRGRYNRSNALHTNSD